MNGEFLGIEDVTLGQWAGQLVVAVQGYALRGDVQPLPAPAGLYGPWIVPQGDLAQRVLVMSRRSPADLHRRFAVIGCTPFRQQGRKALDFANRWGLLGDTSQDGGRRTLYPLVDDARDNPFVNGECLNEWRERAAMVAALVLWWDLVASGAPELKRHILWDGATNSLRYFFSFIEGKLSTDRTFHVDRKDHIGYRTLTTGDGKGHDCWDAVVNGQTRQGERMFRVYPELRGPQFDAVRAGRLVLYRQIEKQLAGNIRAGLDMQREPERALVLYPTGLWGAIWVHFAREVMGHGAALARCAFPECDNMFAPRPGRRFCSPACKQKGYRRGRRHQAPRAPSPK